jgi:hypothetical protein
VRSHPATARAIDALGLRERVRLTLPRFDVGVHWYRRYEHDAGNRWLRETVVEMFGEGRQAARWRVMLHAPLRAAVLSPRQPSFPPV